jgi:predicted nicotinamide N-methyase
MKLSRRELAVLAAAGLVAQAQAEQGPQEAFPADLAKAAREAVQRNSEALSKFDVPMATEPAFLFRP